MASELTPDQPSWYRLVVDGQMDARWQRWFDGLTVTPLGERQTALQGRLADTTALYGMISRLRDLGLVLVSVERIDSPPDSPV